MDCPHCSFTRNSMDAVCCGGCGKKLAQRASSVFVSTIDDPSLRVTPPVQLKVRCGQASPNDPCYLRVELTNLTSDAQKVEFSVESKNLTDLPRHESQRLNLWAGGSIPAEPIPFTAVSGSHIVEFDVDVGGQRWRGYYPLAVSESRPIQITQQVTNQGDYIIGDHPVSMTVNLSDGGQVDAAQPVTIDLHTHQTRRVTRKRLHRGNGDAFKTGNRICLRLPTDSTASRSVCLVVGETVRLGRSKQSDIKLVCSPHEDPDERKSEQISRHHGAVKFTEAGARWLESSGSGSEIRYPDGRQSRIGTGKDVELRSGTQLRIGGALSLRIEMPPLQLNPDAHDYYQKFAETECSVQHTHPNCTALRVVRLDQWQDLETYVLFSGSALIGTSPECAVQLADPGIAYRHAWLHFLDDRFWLEPTSANADTQVDGETVPLHHLAPLTTLSQIRLGTCSITVSPFEQRKRNPN